MPRNLEIKATCPSLSVARGIARKIGARYIGAMHQIDTYYRTRSGRLKVREIDGKEFELIYYERPNRSGSRYSNYLVIPLPEVHTLKRSLRRAFGELVVVRKERELFLFKNARIHLDRVARLGAFLEFEVLVRFGRKQSEELLRFLKIQFDVRLDSVVAGSYSDMLLREL